MTEILDEVIQFNFPSKFTLSDSTKLEFVGSSLQLKLIDNPAETFNQPFTSDTGFTYDSSKTEFTGGVVQQKDVTPANSTFFASYETTINGSWGDGDLTATVTGGATISGGYLDLTGTGDFVDYDADLNADSQQTGAIRLIFQPNYSGTPSTRGNIFTISQASGSTNNTITVAHLETTGDLRISILSNLGANIVAADLGVWSPTSGVDYEFELNYDITVGATRLFVDGTQFGSTQTGTGTRSININLLRVGANPLSTQDINGKIGYFLVFNAVQHTADYTPVPCPACPRYVTDVITLPAFTYTGLGDIQAFTDFLTTENNFPYYVLNGLWWNGATWTTSNNTYAQATPALTVAAQIDSLPAADTLTVKIITDDSNDQMDVDDLTVEYTGQLYPTDNPYATWNDILQTDELITWAETSVSSPAFTALKYIVQIDAQDKYWTGSVWADSDGTYAQSNTVSELSDNFATLDLSLGVDSTFKFFLHSDDGTVTPSLTTITVTYDFYEVPTVINECIITGHVKDMSGNPVDGAQLKFYEQDPFWHGDTLISLEKTILTDSQGYFEESIVETASVSRTISVQITYSSGGEIIFTQQFNNIIIPNQTSARLADLIT